MSPFADLLMHQAYNHSTSISAMHVGHGYFSKEFIFIPVHSGFHWTLNVICYPSPADTGRRRKVLHLDSLPGLQCFAEMLLSCLVASIAC